MCLTPARSSRNGAIIIYMAFCTSFIQLILMSTYRPSSHRAYFQKVLHVSYFLLGKSGALPLLRARAVGMKKMESCPLRGSHLPPRHSGPWFFLLISFSSALLGAVHCRSGKKRCFSLPQSPARCPEPGSSCCPPTSPHSEADSRCSPLLLFVCFVLFVCLAVCGKRCPLLCPLLWKRRVLTTGPRGKSFFCLFGFCFLMLTTY